MLSDKSININLNIYEILKNKAKRAILMRDRVIRIGVLGVICCLLLPVATFSSQRAKVRPMAEDSVLRVLYYGGLKGNIAPCG